MTDVIVASGATIQRFTEVSYGPDAQTMEWTFNAQQIFAELGGVGLSYSFINTSCTFFAPSFAPIQMGNGSASAEGGIKISFDADVSSVMAGADGRAITSVHAARNGTVTVSLLKNSPANKLLSALHELTRTAPTTIAGLGQLVITYKE